ncbi:MAG: hypothetical protein EAZ74_06315 [Alphaproteobacteria bacterium]|nr:MAG: hypothetical protein EAY76_01465 [Alphaproteobacteria bacterium]TAF13160.1 MAG: hypothetical protein EAZ74_06315 [Alphaproteobacteria bacterium]TAF75783.1 MAG: hypothetical protein EAZ52_05845 [Alphaproteobacteria bacterium]
MAYKLSERLYQDYQQPPSKEAIDWKKVALVFFLFSIISFITALFYTTETKKIYDGEVYATYNQQNEKMVLMGPLMVKQAKEVYEITIQSDVPENSWVFIEGEVLDANKEYLFSFGQELWHETGYDDEGAWREQENDYSMKVTFPQAGQYYLNFKKEGSYNTDKMHVTLSQKRGSSLPHMIFAVITCLIGVALQTVHGHMLAQTNYAGY